ncbi:putative invertase inhibitor [Rhodamnia argentea]|uniref:Invertase inhibitor n=1 Tax=Rhodamnia argentea TaxID=178133 RepID=A0ABM3HW36_9MYRT|nr:putative invertase inhibitor [Rhodamnia argentea]
MATSYALRLFCNLSCSIFLASIISRSWNVIADSGLVDKVYKQASDYKFCNDALNSDPRTPGADEITLAYVAFGLAYRKASSTQLQITSLLNNSTSPVHEHLEQCHGDYVTAIAKIQEALTDLDSETYDGLAGLASKAGDRAVDCESAFNRTKSPLTDNNRDLKGLSEICVAVAHLFS